MFNFDRLTTCCLITRPLVAKMKLGLHEVFLKIRSILFIPIDGNLDNLSKGVLFKLGPLPTIKTVLFKYLLVLHPIYL